ncbi:MAG: aminodeoxychorismate synthase component I [Campylobacteraceae bacterium 4484_166]|nr:MAG: aminodeoxychorismate synthase component I [Campylobacteraceae bacterium 4484_166]
MCLKKRLNQLGRSKKPFFCLISFDKMSVVSDYLSNIPETIKYEFDFSSFSHHNIKLKHQKINKNLYKDMFQKVQQNIKAGNTYLLNLTAVSKLNTKLSLDEIYQASNSSFKLLFKDKFVSFSPEKFITIQDDMIYTYPMKGTIDFAIKDAKNRLLLDKKELAEHTMVVDLLRHDIGQFASNVKVDRFRYIDKLTTTNKTILQTSSKISGLLKTNSMNNIGDILEYMLPAGSITGAPKISTNRLINSIEQHPRGFFTGIFGVFDGSSFRSFVLIRYIFKDKDSLYYHSGGGITSDSIVDDEFDELNDKIYLV